MGYGVVDDAFVQQLQDVLPPGTVSVDPEQRRHYGHDETEDLVHPPDVVVRPLTTAQVAAVVRLCARHRVPVTPIGGRTGLSGGALCVHGGVGLSVDRMDAIVHIDTDNMQVTVQPGVITQVLQDAVAAHGLYYPPDPASRGSCTIGGNLAENAGGPRAVKYGVTRDFVLDLEVVLPDGEVVRTGARTLKNATGYDLTHLVVGSEGTLGIITEAVLRLVPLPTENRLMLVPFASAVRACEAVSAVFRAGVVPSALEFMERDAIAWTMRFTDDLPTQVDTGPGAYLLVEVDGHDAAVLLDHCATIAGVMEDHGAGEVLLADDAATKEALWRLRRSVPVSVKAHSVYKEEDTVVPRFALPRLLEGVKAIGGRHGFRSVCYGHAGDGNLHVNIIKGDLPDGFWRDELPGAVREIFALVVSLGGTLSGEHGIGLVQRPYMDIVFSPRQLALMRAIKQAFDPLGIMNPGKVLP
ncbi:MAG: FAD-linked oxidase C-terminal domain-containing protein [Flavobacteriales bacterium]|jgi:glycolate oxidase|nr:FAD-linked oxidase C-terminal domain-containing protein [Flavobacteriales bacterium]